MKRLRNYRSWIQTHSVTQPSSPQSPLQTLGPPTLAALFSFPFSDALIVKSALFWDRIYEAGSECQEKKANFSEGAPEELKGVAD